MEKQVMDKLIHEELERIPAGPSGGSQNKLRACYKMRRQNCLKEDPQQSRSDPFREAVEDVRKEYPAFSPNLPDPEYFGWRDK